MNRLIIIGNGFDLAHDLKTSYGDFMNSYFRESFAKIEPLTAERSFDPYSRQFRINEKSFLFSFSDDLFELSVNFSDFSAEELDKRFNDLKSVIEYLNSYCSVVKNKGYDEFDVKKFSSYPFVKQLFMEVDAKKWIDIEAMFFHFLKSFIEKQEELVQLNDQLKSIEQKLTDYLSSQQHNLDKSKEEYTQMKQIISPQESKGEVCVLNFNYTNTIEHYLDEKDANVIYIHGKLGDEKNPIIFGYGDDHHEDYLKLQEAGNDELLKHQKSMLYPRTDNYGRMEYFLESSVDEGFEVLILGHSCGLSDRTLLRTIFEHDNCKKIHIAFYENVNDFDSKVIAISRHFVDKTKMRSRIAPFNEALKIPQFKEYKV